MDKKELKALKLLTISAITYKKWNDIIVSKIRDNKEIAKLYKELPTVEGTVNNITLSRLKDSGIDVNSISSLEDVMKAMQIKSNVKQQPEVTEGVHGFKVFNPDWTCSPEGNTKQYTCPGKFEEDGELHLCSHGMHFCENLADCFLYYPFDSSNKVAEVIAYGQVLKGEDISCTDKLEIVREISRDEVLRLVNTGKNCTGFGNTGNDNSGNYNTGDKNIGNGCTGNKNIGYKNAGNDNIGDCNTGNKNIGSYCTGDWNKASFSTGCFMTKEPKNKISMFNRPSDWSFWDWKNSEAYHLLNQIPPNPFKWVDFTQLWWDNLTDQEKNIIKALPNFDSEIFKEITGIDVEQRNMQRLLLQNKETIEEN